MKSLFQDVFFQGCSHMRGSKRPPSLKSGTYIQERSNLTESYLTYRTHKTRNIFLEFCWDQYFFIKKYRYKEHDFIETEKVQYFEERMIKTIKRFSEWMNCTNSNIHWIYTVQHDGNITTRQEDYKKETCVVWLLHYL